MSNFVSVLFAADLSILRWLNVDCAVPALDPFWNAVSHLDRHPLILAVTLPLLLLWMFSIYRFDLIKIFAVLVVGIGLCDLLSYRVVKGLVNRERPFQNVEVATWVRHVGDAHGPSFPSNHAANNFAAAVILAGFFRRERYFFYAFASLVALSRIELGVHYPSDVLAGAILGASVGFLVRLLVIQLQPWLKIMPYRSADPIESAGWRSRVRRTDES